MKKDLQKIIGDRKGVIRDLIEDERYVDYNKKPLNFLGVPIRTIRGRRSDRLKSARVLVAPKSAKSIVGRDWLVALRYKITQPIERGV